MQERRKPSPDKPQRQAKAPPAEDGFARDILDRLADIIAVVDEHGRLCYANAAAAQLIGVSPGDLVGQPISVYLHPSDAAALAAHLDTEVPTAGMALRWRPAAPEARGRWLDTTISALARHSAPVRFMLVARTTREALPVHPMPDTPDSEQRFGQWRIEIGQPDQIWTREIYTFFGVEPHEVTDRSRFMLDRLHPEDRGRVLETIQRALALHEPFSYRCRSLAGDGQYHHILTHGYVEVDGGGIARSIVAICHDVTEAVEAEDLLRRRELEFRRLSEEAADMISRHDVQGRWLYVSPSVKRMLGWEPEDLIGKNSLDLVHPDDRQRNVDVVKALLSGEDRATITYRARRRDGEYVWLETAVRAVRIDDGQRLREIIAFARDVTERKRAEAEIAAARERAEAASATKSRFLANMSHELRTPLNAIMGFSDIIRRELFGPIGAHRYREYAQLIQDSGAHLLDLINDILDMSKIEAGKFDLRLEEIDIEELVHSSIKLVQSRAQDAGLQLSAEFGPARQVIRADRRSLKQVVLNLLTNAIKFTPAGGLVSVSVESLMEGIALQISDTGIGIAPEDVNRVMLPFEQATDNPLLAQAGSGLGLALVQSLVTLHHGSLKIDSQPGRGTVVTVFLPYDPRSRQAA